MRLKPLPKIILILAVVGGVGYGINTYLTKKHEAEAAAQFAPQFEQPVQQAPQQPAPVYAQPAPAPAPAYQPAPAPTPQNSTFGQMKDIKKL
jgi:hypothetical protein